MRRGQQRRLRGARAALPAAAARLLPPHARLARRTPRTCSRRSSPPSFNAMLADDRPINARPWLYRIARNRCLNHLRRPQPAGQDSMDVFERDDGATTADTVHRREEFRQIVADVQDLPETQRTALLLREIDALSYDQIAEAMDTTVPSVKSLLVRARVIAGRGRRGAPAHLRGGPARARPGGRGARQDLRARAPPPARPASAAAPSRSSCARPTRRSRRSTRSARSWSSRSSARQARLRRRAPLAARGPAAARPAALASPPRRPPRPRDHRRRARSRPASARSPRRPPPAWPPRRS